MIVTQLFDTKVKQLMVKYSCFSSISCLTFDYLIWSPTDTVCSDVSDRTCTLLRHSLPPCLFLSLCHSLFPPLSAVQGSWGGSGPVGNVSHPEGTRGAGQLEVSTHCFTSLG